MDDGLVYAVGPTGVFHCLRADTGEKVWRHDLGDEFPAKPLQYGVSFSPLVEGDLVYAITGGQNGNSVVAFDKRSGALVWKSLDDPTAYSSPTAATIAGVRQLLVFTNIALVSLSPRTGAVNWRYPWKTENGFNIATPLVFGDYVFISSGYGKGCALLEVTADPDGGLGALAAQRADRVYEHNRMRNHFASSVRCGDDIYGFDQTDLVCMDARTGEIRWREKGFRKFGKGNLLAADGRLILLGESGVLALAEATPAGYRETASFQASRNKCWTVPALREGGSTCATSRRSFVMTCGNRENDWRTASSPASPQREARVSRKAAERKPLALALRCGLVGLGQLWPVRSPRNASIFRFCPSSTGCNGDTGVPRPMPSRDSTYFGPATKHGPLRTTSSTIRLMRSCRRAISCSSPRTAA